MTTELDFFRIVHDEEDIEYFVNGHSVSRVNHDCHGRDGMEAVDMMFECIASALGTHVFDRAPK